MSNVNDHFYERICDDLYLSYPLLRHVFLSRLKYSVWISKANEYIHCVDVMLKQCTLRVKDLKLFETMYHIPVFICTHFLFTSVWMRFSHLDWYCTPFLWWLMVGDSDVVSWHWMFFSRFLHFLPVPRNPPSEKWGEWISINQLHFVCAWQRTGKKEPDILKNKLPRLPVCVQKGRGLSCSNQNMNSFKKCHRKNWGLLREDIVQKQRIQTLRAGNWFPCLEIDQ